MTLLLNGTNGVSDVDGSASTPAVRGTDANTGIFFPAADTIAFAEGGAEVARFDSSGNLGVGTSSPSYALDIIRDANSFQGIRARNNNTGSSADAGVLLNGSGNSWAIACGSSAKNSNALTFTIDPLGTPTERMRIDSSGNLLLATTSSAGNFKLQVVNTDSSSNALWLQNNSGNDRGIAVFKHGNATGGTTGNMASFQNASGTTVGSIVSSNTATSYNTSSDYRLKENIAPMTGALATVSALKPCTYTWKADGSNGQGFIAHELQEVCPDAVVGEKDAVDEEGNPKYQGIDTSFLVATLTAAIQEQQAIITDLKSRIEALEQA